jgi:hypothetical protein
MSELPTESVLVNVEGRDVIVRVPKREGISLYKVVSDPKVVATILSKDGLGKEFAQGLAEFEARIKEDEHTSFSTSTVYEVNGALAAMVYGYAPPWRFIGLLYFRSEQEYSDALGETMLQISEEFFRHLHWELMDWPERQAVMENTLVEYMTPEELLAYGEAEQQIDALKRAREELHGEVLSRKLSDWEDKLSAEDRKLLAKISPENREFVALAYPDEIQCCQELVELEIAFGKRLSQIYDVVRMRLPY